jgi:serine/threonine-protein kinase SRPK3
MFRLNTRRFISLPSFAFFNLNRLGGVKSPAKWPEEPLDLPFDQGGGFYSASFGEKLNSRYTIVQKLGWGQHSSVWLAKDDQGTQPYVSVKILSAHATVMQNRVADELGLLCHLRDSALKSNHPGCRHIMTFIDNFEFVGPHGRHLCLVQSAMGTLPMLRNGRFPVTVVKSIAKQLLCALSFLHSECHVVHTGVSTIAREFAMTDCMGDLKPDNILVDLRHIEPAQDDAADKASINRPVSPESATLSHPLQEFSLVEIDNLIKLSQFNIRLTDFGTGKS